ncbi:MAG: MFS transporter [Cellulomonas sp.]
MHTPRVHVPDATPFAVDPSAVARARRLLMGLFALNGLMYSSWLARIPAVRDALGLSTAELGVVLLAGSVGALATVTLSGALVTRYGGRVGLLLSSVGFAFAFALIGLGPTLGLVPLLALGIFLNGVSFALGNVPLNVETAAVERRMRRTVLPQFHAAFSIGAVIGSLLGATAARLGVPLMVQFAATAIVGTVWRLVSIRGAVLESRPSLPVRLLSADVSVDGTTGPAVPRESVRTRSAFGAWTERRTLLIGVVIMAAAFTEGSANDWLSLAVVDGFHRPEAVGAAVFGVFVASMTGVRLLGTRLIDRWGRVAVLRVSGVVSFAGLAVFGLAPRLEVAVLGVAAWGLGAALAVPIGIAAASDDPTRAAGRVSVVSAFSSMAALAAPPLLGLVAESVGARHALLLITVAMVASVSVARVVARPVVAALPPRPGAATASDERPPERLLGPSALEPACPGAIVSERVAAC